MKHILFFALTIVSFFTSSTFGEHLNDCSAGWRELDWKMVPFIELNARYFSYQFKIPRGKKLNFKIEGTFPYSRYFSFHTYNQESEDPISHLTDFSILPEPGSVNPFQVGVDRYSPNRQFAVWVNPSQEPLTHEQKLIIPFDESRDRLADIWFRVYANEAPQIELPKIYAFDEFMNPLDCPEILQKEWSIATEAGPYGLRIPSREQEGKVPAPFKNGDIHFFKPSTSSLGANMDNYYLSTRLDGKALFNPLTFKGRLERRILKRHNAILNIGNISIFAFQVPSFPDTKAKLKYFSGEEDVRYWSLCLSGADTYTNGCIMDSDAKTITQIDGKKYAVFVVGPNDNLLKNEIKKMGYNYLDHSEQRVPILFFRQMLPRDNFQGKFELVKALSPEEAKNENGLWEFFGENQIGKYSPFGKQCWLGSDFLDSFCGFKELLPKLP